MQAKFAISWTFFTWWMSLMALGNIFALLLTDMTLNLMLLNGIMMWD